MTTSETKTTRENVQMLSNLALDAIDSGSLGHVELTLLVKYCLSSILPLSSRFCACSGTSMWRERERERGGGRKREAVVHHTVSELRSLVGTGRLGYYGFFFKVLDSPCAGHKPGSTCFSSGPCVSLFYVINTGSTGSLGRTWGSVRSAVCVSVCVCVMQNLELVRPTGVHSGGPRTREMARVECGMFPTLFFFITFNIPVLLHVRPPPPKPSR
jgi:hypothetical protein